MTVLVIDDHAGFRAAARSELEAGGLAVVGELGRALSAVDTARRLRPDVVVVDIRLPDGDGVRLGNEIRVAVPESTVVLTSSMSADDAGERLAAAGSRLPFLHKTELSGQAVRTLVGA